jgi:hypothetical protein
LRGGNLLLDVHQKLFRFDHGQTQVADVTKIISRLIAITPKLRD